MALHPRTIRTREGFQTDFLPCNGFALDMPVLPAFFSVVRRDHCLVALPVETHGRFNIKGLATILAINAARIAGSYMDEAGRHVFIWPCLANPHQWPPAVPAHPGDAPDLRQLRGIRIVVDHEGEAKLILPEPTVPHDTELFEDLRAMLAGIAVDSFMAEARERRAEMQRIQRGAWARHRAGVPLSELDMDAMRAHIRSDD